MVAAGLGNGIRPGDEARSLGTGRTDPRHEFFTRDVRRRWRSD